MLFRSTNIYSNIKRLFNFKAKNIYEVYELNRQKRKLYSCSQNHYIPINKKNRKTNKWELVHYKAEDLYKMHKDFFRTTTTPTMFSIDKFSGRENCKIEAYTLGAWLGDGHFSSSLKLIKNKNYKMPCLEIGRAHV